MPLLPAEQELALPPCTWDEVWVQLSSVEKGWYQRVYKEVESNLATWEAMKNANTDHRLQAR